VNKPRKRDAVRTRNAILRAATAEFAAKGLGGGRTDDIARRAGVNKRMIYHYFGNKEGLYLEVLENVYKEIRDREKELNLDDTDPMESMRNLVRFSCRYFLENPYFVNILSNENIHEARYVRKSAVIRGMHSPLVDMIRKVLDRGVAEGDFRANVDPVRLYITIAALGFFYHSNTHTLSAIFGRDLQGRAALRGWENHAIAVVLGYLRP